MEVHLKSKVKSNIDEVIEKYTSDNIDKIDLTNEEFKELLKYVPPPISNTIKFSCGKYHGSSLVYKGVLVKCVDNEYPTNKGKDLQPWRKYDEYGRL